MRGSPEAGTDKFSKHYSAEICGGGGLVLMCYPCREAVLALRFTRINPNLCIPPSSACWDKTALGGRLCLHCQSEPPWLTFSCSVLWPRMGEKEPEVPVNYTLKEACEEKSS